MKSVLISIQPKWCELIASGKKTVEVRKTKPKLETPFKVYVYCTYGEGLIEYADECLPNMLIGQRVTKDRIWSNCCNGKVIGEFVCDSFEYYTSNCTAIESVLLPSPNDLAEMCLTLEEFNAYGARGKLLYGWRISDLVIYDKPKELGEFIKPCNHENDCCTCDRYDYIGHRCYNEVTRPPQSWCYVEELKGE